MNLDVDAERARQGAEAAIVALADGAEFPLLAMAIEFAEDHRGVGRRIFGQVVTGQLAIVRFVDDADEGVYRLCRKSPRRRRAEGGRTEAGAEETGAGATEKLQKYKIYRQMLAEFFEQPEDNDCNS